MLTFVRNDNEGPVDVFVGTDTKRVGIIFWGGYKGMEDKFSVTHAPVSFSTIELRQIADKLDELNGKPPKAKKPKRSTHLQGVGHRLGLGNEK